MSTLIEFTTAAGTVMLDPDEIVGVSNDGGATSKIYTTGGHEFEVTDAYADIEVEVNEGKLFGRVRAHEVRVLNARTS